MAKFISASDSVKLIKNGSTVAVGGFIGAGHPEEISTYIEKSYLENKLPRDLTLVYAAGQGDSKDRGLNHFGQEGLIKRVIGGHWGLVPKIQKLALENKIEAYNLPQGVISHLYRDIAANKPGTITKVGLKTFIDPRIEGGKLNEVTKDEIVSLVNILDQEYLLYEAFPIDVVLLRGTYSDKNGNISFEKEVAPLDAVAMAQAARNSGGIVIVQVEGIVNNESLSVRNVKLPGILVDYVVVVKDKKNHMQTFTEDYNPSFSGSARVSLSSLEPMKLNERKIISRRAALELKPNCITNLGIGVPEGIASVGNEENIGEYMKLTIESGPVGGVPAAGLNFGASSNPDSILEQNVMFDFYDGGGLDIAFLGLAQCDKRGNINVSKFGPKIAGCGGFINITQNAKKVVYCGTFTAGGLKVEVSDNKLNIINEGRSKKFIDAVEQITFSGEYANQIGQVVLYVTERAVFELTYNGVKLIEIAPGIDIKKDILDLMDFEPIIDESLKVMDSRIFGESLMGIADMLKEKEEIEEIEEVIA